MEYCVHVQPRDVNDMGDYDSNQLDDESDPTISVSS